MTTRRKRTTVYDVITDRLIELLDQGVVPWRRPWHGVEGPVSLASGRKYTGANALLLNAVTAAMGYRSPYWLTRKEAKRRGGYVTGRGWPVIFYKMLVKQHEDEETGQQITETVPLIRYYLVWNLDRAVNVKAPPEPEPPSPDFRPIERCEQVLEHMPQRPAIRHVGNRAYYDPASDVVTMPDRSDFESVEAYYRVLWHELGHATGHPSRLNRPTIASVKPFGTPDYSFEELVAECCAAFVCGETGLDPDLDNSAAYIKGWIAAFRNDKRMLIRAASKAQKAADFILNRQPTD